MPIYKPQGVKLSLGLERLVFDEKLPEKSRLARQARATTGITDTFEIAISDEARGLRLEAELIRATLGGVEVAIFGLDDPLYEQAGRSEYLESIDAPDDLSAGGTAERILGGITGYIYRAFLLGQPDADVEDLARFKTEALRGLEQGLEEARGYIEALGDLTDGQSERISETEDIVREALDAFFEREEERLRGG
ncbi:MAG: DUF5610 domain-containing protein [Myxococcota bacterium]